MVESFITVVLSLGFHSFISLGQSTQCVAGISVKLKSEPMSRVLISCCSHNQSSIKLAATHLSIVCGGWQGRGIYGKMPGIHVWAISQACQKESRVWIFLFRGLSIPHFHVLAVTMPILAKPLCHQVWLISKHLPYVIPTFQGHVSHIPLVGFLLWGTCL